MDDLSKSPERLESFISEQAVGSHRFFRPDFILVMHCFRPKVSMRLTILQLIRFARDQKKNIEIFVAQRAHFDDFVNLI